MKDPEYDLQNTGTLRRTSILAQSLTHSFSVERHRPFFECARQLADTYADPAQKTIYYLVTDSANLKRDAARILGSQLIVTDMVPQHVHQKSGHADGVLGAVVEDWILQKTDMRVITQDSGFVSASLRLWPALAAFSELSVVDVFSGQIGVVCEWKGSDDGDLVSSIQSGPRQFAEQKQPPRRRLYKTFGVSYGILCCKLQVVR